MIKKWILLSLCFFLMSCGYKGDGDFKSYGYWPLITYELTLPDFPFETGSKHKFDLKGYKSHETSAISIELFSDNEHDFAELDTEVELKIVNDLGVTFFYRKSPLNAHFKRMQELKEASWANEYEWNGRYSYKNQDVSDRAVPFSSIEMPAKTKSMRYFNFFPSDAGSLSLTINIGSVPSQFEDLKVRINLSSGWK